MKSYSEKTQREVTRYIVKLVRSQPGWLKTLFEQDKVFFCVEDNGTLTISIADTIQSQQGEKICKLISQWIDKHPTALFNSTTVQ